MYNLLVSRQDVPDRVGGFLSDFFHVGADEVEVVDAHEMEDRNWDALVSCEYEQRRGDLAWALSIYAVDPLPGQPAEEELAASLSEKLQTVTLFPEGTTAPSVWRLATPRGELMHARLREPEEIENESRVIEVEAPVPEFPGAAVARFPDIINEVQLPTPLTDSGFPSVEEHRAMQWSRSLLGNWEQLTARMAAGWPPSAWYPVSMYAEDLRYRDELDEQIRKLPADAKTTAEELRQRIDEQFRELTIDDGGASLIRAGETSPEQIAERHWYWRRRPDPVPWEED